MRRRAAIQGDRYDFRKADIERLRLAARRSDRLVAAVAICALVTVPFLPRVACADAGPPFLTNDPGTPGSGNWEINLGAMPTIGRDLTTYQLPQIDANFGVGERLQLTYEVPHVFASSAGEPHASGWGNSFLGIKWRFFDQGVDGWQFSTFPQLETAGSTAAQRHGIAVAGPRLLVPIEIAKTFGAFRFNFEAGRYVSRNGDDENIIGLVAGLTVTPRLELDGELYYDHVLGASPVITLNLGGRYRLHRAFVLLFMAGRGANSSSAEKIQFTGYLGVQMLLSDYGRSLTR